VIIPLPEIKTVVDKTAYYVAKNGQSFESMIMKVEANNPKFNFIRHVDDPYRPYYNMKLEEFTTDITITEPTTAPEKAEVQSILSAPVKREHEY
jgi:hypothetical protein